MLIETKNILISRVLLSKEFTKGVNSLFEIIELHKTFNRNWWTIRIWGLIYYTGEEIEAIFPEQMIQVP